MRLCPGGSDWLRLRQSSSARGPGSIACTEMKNAGSVRGCRGGMHALGVYVRAATCVTSRVLLLALLFLAGQAVSGKSSFPLHATNVSGQTCAWLRGGWCSLMSGARGTEGWCSRWRSVSVVALGCRVWAFQAWSASIRCNLIAVKWICWLLAMWQHTPLSGALCFGAQLRTS